MRLLFYFLAATLVSCASTKKSTSKPNPLNGTWIPIQQEMGGKAFPKAIYETQKLIILDSNYTVIAESVDKGVVEYNGQKMDIYGREGVNKGKHFTAIYKLENGQLSVCYNLKGDGYPEGFDTNGKPLYFLSVFRKE